MASRIQVCGRVVAEIDGRGVEDALPGRQGRLLFVYLVANRLRAASRDELVDAVWPDAPPANVDSSLSALLSKVRRLVPIEGRGAVRIVLGAETWVDLEAAAEALHRAESAIAQSSWTEAWGPARVTQHVTARGFLAGESAPWIEELRRRLEDMQLRALELVGRASIEIGGTELDTAERSARTLVEKAPYRESGHRLLMEVLGRRDNRAEALHVYETLRTLLRNELGVVPSAATQDVHRRLLG